MTAKAGKYLTFELCGHMYAVAIDIIASILNEWGHISPVPEFPDYGVGAISHWGYVIPVIDPRIRMNLPGAASAETTCLIVVNMAEKVPDDSGSGGMMGLLADRIRNIMDFDGEGLCEAPRLTSHTSGYITGVYKASDTIILIVDPRLLVTEDMNRAFDNYMNEQHSS